MIPTWPRKSPHAKAAKRLGEAINTTAHTDALADFVASTDASTREATVRLQEMRDAVTQAVTDIDALLAGLDAYSRTAKQARNIRDDLAALINESDRP